VQIKEDISKAEIAQKGHKHLILEIKKQAEMLQYTIEQNRGMEEW